MRHRLTSFCILLLFFLFLCFPHEVFQGASRGLDLWFRTVLPTLFPFVILSSLLLETNSIHYMTDLVYPILRPLLGVSKAGSFAVIVGFLCGYPMGAKITAQLFSAKKITEQEAGYLLSFCNNASPVFIIDYIAAVILKNVWPVSRILLILIAAPLIVSIPYRFFYLTGSRLCAGTLPAPSGSARSRDTFILLNNAILNGFETLIYVAGYIMLFTIILTIGAHLCSMPRLLCLLANLEITSGLLFLRQLPLTETQLLLLVLPMASFGGVCSIFQTRCMLRGTSISIRPYITEKLVTALVTSLLTIVFL
ncbi:nucleoside recognition domain-containing protein [Hespellia stercorisuis]|uniref:Sporulation integral membrane protein YlbJ n=1 Tax=Hespellia stercorisuis DSM 15480 TaxID=1121950 RepID=A0A1M6S2C6_9FIRM|nr:nucleoside recognition domain-containing protein [Hespellia stercorisuis]SHK38883.1 sporulation integral membrane protein YlbJ [Hespellia stercorisuis DSM 15480]